MKQTICRYAWFILGIVINGFGVAAITKAALGTSPISSVPYVLNLRFPFSLGQFTFIFNMFLILGQWLLLKKDFKPFQFLQIGVTFIFSACIDLSMALLSFLQPDGIFACLVSLLVGCAILAFGISVEVAPDVLMVPGEGLVSAITRVTGKRFGSVKVIFDTTLMACALILSLLFFQGINGLGLGTILSALIVGKIVNFLNRHLKLITLIRQLRPQETATASSN